MLPNDNNAARMRTQILIKIAEAYLGNNLEATDRIPLELRPKEMASTRCCIYKDRAVLKYRCMAAMGHSTEDETDELKSLSSYAKDALKRDKADGPVLTVIDTACSACISAQYLVTNACRGCFAQPCRVNCPKNAISMINGKAKIDPDLCINCGRCKDMCPYHAVIRVPIPCEEACPVDAISKDEHGKEHIDHEKCISCGKCLRSCPFGAIMEKSQILDVLKQIKETDKEVVAMVAPAVMGQFPGDINQIVGAIKAVGFDKVIEVAVGADVTTRNEGEEFVERMEEGAEFMTTSCCPAYVQAVRKHIPEIEPFVSHTLSPMRYTSEIVKQEMPDCVSVFIGPCIAKRVEGMEDANTDYVMTFEELGALFVASGVMVGECEPAELDRVASGESRAFPLTGGVAGAVAAYLEGTETDYRPETVDGLTVANIKTLKRYATKKGTVQGNMLEVMCCEGGCISGPGTIALPNKATRTVTKYKETSPSIKETTKKSSCGGGCSGCNCCG